jgi:hypothetical protein
MCLEHLQFVWKYWKYFKVAMNSVGNVYGLSGNIFNLLITAANIFDISENAGI